MRSNDRLRALWRSVDGAAPTRGVDFDGLAARINLETSLALRARRSWGRWTRVAVTAGVAASVVAALAIALTPTRPTATRPTATRPADSRSAGTLLGAVSGDEASARAFEVAAVGPRDGEWVIAAAVSTDRAGTDQ
jgi:hypothetical protein